MSGNENKTNEILGVAPGNESVANRTRSRSRSRVRSPTVKQRESRSSEILSTKTTPKLKIADVSAKVDLFTETFNDKLSNITGVLQTMLNHFDINKRPSTVTVECNVNANNDPVTNTNPNDDIEMTTTNPDDAWKVVTHKRRANEPVGTKRKLLKRVPFNTEDPNDNRFKVLLVDADDVDDLADVQNNDNFPKLPPITRKFVETTKAPAQVNLNNKSNKNNTNTKSSINSKASTSKTNNSNNEDNLNEKKRKKTTTNYCLQFGFKIIKGVPKAVQLY